MSARERLHVLDALRGFAALWVVLYHDVLRYPRFVRGEAMDMTPLLPGFAEVEAGIVPVLWFFLISGFVIAWTIERSPAPMDFVVSRFSRLYPTYWAALALAGSLSLLWPLPYTHVTAAQVAVNATMLQEYVGIDSIDGAYWSLAVELLFYAYALGLFCLGWWRRLHLVAFAWAALCLLAAALGQLGVWVPWRATRYLLLQYGPFLAAGMMLYQLWRGRRPRWSVLTLALCAAAVLLSLRPAPAATCILAALVIYWGARGGLAFLAAPWLVWLGAISYALYVSHETVSFTLMWALDGAGAPHWLAVSAGGAFALGVASAITYGIERPAMRAIRAAWRRRRAVPA